jgi:serine/threonine protein kinase
VAVKQLKRPDTLESINRVNHKHIIKPVATYKKEKDQCIVLPWADGGSLRDYWYSRNMSSALLERDYLVVRWALEQMTGLSDALKTLHGKYYGHGNLKPENILCFKSNRGDNTLVISDIGTAKVRRFSVELGENETAWRILTIRDAPPDEITKSTLGLSRSGDVWSMGCIFLEFLIWLLYGKKGLSEFDKSSNFEKYWEKVNGKVRISQHVQYWLDHMWEELEPHTALHDILYVIRTRLLVVAVKRPERKPPAPDPDVDIRANASVVAELLSNILEKATQQSDKYLFDDVWLLRHGTTPNPPIGRLVALQVHDQQ